MAHTSGPRPSDPEGRDAARVALLAALVDGDLSAAYDVTAGLLSEGVTFDEIVAKVLTPVQTELGTRWRDTDLSVADEHAATAAAESLVTLLAGDIATDDGHAVVVACPSGETHALAARIVATTLAMNGFRSLLLGASMPPSALADYLEFQEPLALALSVSMPSSLRAAVQSAAAAHDLGVPVVVGGRALAGSPERARKLGADAFAASPTDAVDVVSEWEHSPPGQLTAAPPAHPEADGLEGARTGLVATALSVVPRLDPELMPVLGAELARVLEVLQGALVLGEAEIVAGHVDSLRASTAAYGIEGADLELTMTALAELVRPAFPEGHLMLSESIH